MRAFIGVLDSFGIGAAPDAALFGDAGANTFGHIAEACAKGLGDGAGRAGPLKLPNLMALGLGLAAAQVANRVSEIPRRPLGALFGAAKELSKGKDTPSGHWEMMGVPVDHDWGYFPQKTPTFPSALTQAFIEQARVPGILGDCHASGTVIIDQYGEEHIRTGKPICYTSADSVFQIAAHEEHFGLQRLYEISEIARKLVDPYNVGRVIARPFVGETRGSFKRTYNRRDYAMPPPSPTLLDLAREHGRAVIGIGKIYDIFAGCGVTTSIKTAGNADTFAHMINCAATAPDGSLIFANFVDFDQNFGHRRDIAGYANALEEFDATLPRLNAALLEGDVVILSADHGCDPTMPGSDHTREYVPVLAFGPRIGSGSIGLRDTFADIGQSVADHLQLPPLKRGVSFL